MGDRFGLSEDIATIFNGERKAEDDDDDDDAEKIIDIILANAFFFFLSFAFSLSFFLSSSSEAFMGRRNINIILIDSSRLKEIYSSD